MIGDRIRHARLAAGLTQDRMVELLATHGQAITKACLSKYERSKSTPGPGFFSALGAVLGLKPSYFLSEPAISITWLAYRKRADLGIRRQERIKARVQDIVEGQIWLQNALNPGMEPSPLEPWKVKTLEDAEDAACGLRETWRLGDAPIESVTQSMEDQGCIVVGYPEAEEGFDGLSGRLNSGTAVTAISMAMPADRRRYSLAHELGHLFMNCDALPSNEEESLAHRFAAAFLVPADVARRELGTSRRFVGMGELGLLKEKYGLSMQAWARRATDLGIISKSHYNSLCIEFSVRGWRKQEPSTFRGQEIPTKLKQMTLRALAEKIISRDKAERLCPGCIEDLSYARRARSDLPMSPSEVRKLPRGERDKVLSAAAQKAKEDYSTSTDLTEFEAFGVNDLYD